MITVRLLRKGERIAEDIDDGFKAMADYDHEWVWVAEKDGSQVGAIFGMAAHGVFYFLRISGNGKGGSLWVRKTLRKLFEDVRDRGYNVFVVYLTVGSESETKLYKLVEMGGGVSRSFVGVVTAGNVEAAIGKLHGEERMAEVVNGKF